MSVWTGVVAVCSVGRDSNAGGGIQDPAFSLSNLAQYNKYIVL
jgi:hypothetical protein